MHPIHKPAVQKNATAESIAKATSTNSTGLTGLSCQVL